MIIDRLTGVINDDSVAPMKICDDCQGEFNDTEGRYYHMEADTWLCDGCYDDRMEADDD